MTALLQSCTSENRQLHVTCLSMSDNSNISQQSSDAFEGRALSDSTNDELLADANSDARSSSNDHRGSAARNIHDTAATGSDDVQEPGHEELNTETVANDIHVQLEAFGSGLLLHEGLAIPLNMPVGDFRKLVLTDVELPPQTRTVRLFVGHGGTELVDDSPRVIDTALAAEGGSKPVVVFPVSCTLRHQYIMQCSQCISRASYPARCSSVNMFALVHG